MYKTLRPKMNLMLWKIRAAQKVLSVYGMMTLMMNTKCFFHHGLSLMLTDYSTEVPQESQNNEEGQTDANTDLEGLDEVEGGLTVADTKVTVGAVLTTKRRGLAVFFMLLILAGG